MSRPGFLVRTAAILLAVSSCVEGAAGPGQFGEIRVEPGYRAAYAPDAIGVALDTASVVVTRRGTSEQILASRVPYTGGALAWVVDITADAESVDVAVELWSGGARTYAGDTVVLVESGAIASGESHVMSVSYVGPPVISIVTVAPGTETLTAPGATRQYAAEARDPDGNVVASAQFTWSSSNPAAATIDPVTGVATAIANGSTSITAAAGSVTGSAVLGVNLPPVVASVEITPAGAGLAALGATQPFVAVAKDAGNNVIPGATFAWTSSDAAVATIDAATGLATATGHGSTTITATTGSVSGSATLAVNLTPTIVTVVITPANAALAALGGAQQFNAEARDANNNILPGVSFTWASSDGAVATIDAATGLATATGHGSTTITATTGSVSGSATLAVNLAPTVVTVVVTPANAALAALGGAQQFTAEARDAASNVLPGVTFAWASNVATVATIDAATGLATATGHGSTMISATAGSVSGSATLAVNLAPTIATVVVTPANAALIALGATQPFTAEARDASNNVLPGVTFAWSSSDGAVASIDAANGLATATGHGSSTITATAGSVSGSATLAVNLAPTIVAVVVTPGNATLTAFGATQPFTAEARDASNNVLPGVTFAWSSSDGAVASIDAATGLASATGHGSTTITATAGSVSGSATLAVNLAPTIVAVVVTPGNATLTAFGATQPFTAEARDANNNILPGVSFTWLSSDGAVATIDAATGLASATGHGSTTITATAGSVSGSATLAVNLAPTIVAVVVTPGNATLTAFGATQPFTAEARDASNNVLPGVTFTWASSDDLVGTVDAVSGLATAMGQGSTSITATVGSVSGSAQLSVNQVVTAVRVVPDTATIVDIALEQHRQFTAEARDANGNLIAGVVFTWASGDVLVATVDATGLATVVEPGITTISATAGGVTDAATLIILRNGQCPGVRAGDTLPVGIRGVPPPCGP